MRGFVGRSVRRSVRNLFFRRVETKTANDLCRVSGLVFLDTNMGVPFGFHLIPDQRCLFKRLYIGVPFASRCLFFYIRIWGFHFGSIWFQIRDAYLQCYLYSGSILVPFGCRSRMLIFLYINTFMRVSFGFHPDQGCLLVMSHDFIRGCVRPSVRPSVGLCVRP